MSTLEEVNAAVIAYRDALAARSATLIIAQAQRAAYEETINVTGPALIAAAIVEQDALIAAAQVTLAAADEVDGTAEVALYAAQEAMIDTISAYVPPEP